MRTQYFSMICIFVLAGCWFNSVDDQARKLGSRTFTPEAWANASQLERAAMTASFLDQHDTSAFTRKQMEALLGAPTGYYDYNSNAAYVVGPDSVRSIYGKGYLLVFEADKDDGRIDNVFFLSEVE